MRSLRVSAWILVVLGVGPLLLADSVKDIVEEGGIDYDLRYRYENVDQDGLFRSAKASTARLRFGYHTGTFFNFSAAIEFEALKAIGAEDYNSTANGKTQFPVVADPEDEELNQAYLAWSGTRGTTLKLGRQRIIRDNARFIGNVGWRQLEQTFDAFTAACEPGKKTSVFYGFLNNANRIFGEHNPVQARADTGLDAHIASASYQSQIGKVTGYVHFLEFEDAPAASHRNVGARFAGKHGLSDDVDLLYAAEYANQNDYEDAPSTVDADYHLAAVGVGVHGFTVKLAQEVLGGDGTYGFQTPLATLHAFQGWTDRFLSTPAAGIEDVYVSVAKKVGGYKLLGVYHDFSSDAGSIDYGTELGLAAARKLGGVVCSLKYANYDSDVTAVGPAPPGFALDTEIFWISFQIKSD